LIFDFRFSILASSPMPSNPGKPGENRKSRIPILCASAPKIPQGAPGALGVTRYFHHRWVRRRRSDCPTTQPGQAGTKKEIFAKKRKIS
jgi:hypothetical protein